MNTSTNHEIEDEEDYLSLNSEVEKQRYAKRELNSKKIYDEIKDRRSSMNWMKSHSDADGQSNNENGVFKEVEVNNEIEIEEIKCKLF